MSALDYFLFLSSRPPCSLSTRSTESTLSQLLTAQITSPPCLRLPTSRPFLLGLDAFTQVRGAGTGLASPTWHLLRIQPPLSPLHEASWARSRPGLGTSGSVVWNAFRSLNISYFILVSAHLYHQRGHDHSYLFFLTALFTTWNYIKHLLVNLVRYKLCDRRAFVLFLAISLVPRTVPGKQGVQWIFDEWINKQ